MNDTKRNKKALYNTFKRSFQLDLCYTTQNSGFNTLLLIQEIAAQFTWFFLNKCNCLHKIA